jgi:lysozyme family protein
MADKFDSIISDVIRREGGSAVTADPLDPGGLTQFGLTKKDNPKEWADGVVTEDEARLAYRRKYVELPGFGQIPDSHSKVRSQLIDWGVNSGPGIAIQKLQEILGLKVDGNLGQKTLDATKSADPLDLNQKLAVSRIKMLCRICQKNPSQLKFLVGWITRALEFL